MLYTYLARISPPLAFTGNFRKWSNSNLNQFFESYGLALVIDRGSRIEADPDFREEDLQVFPVQILPCSVSDFRKCCTACVTRFSVHE